MWSADVASVRRAPSKQAVKHHAQRVHITCRSDGFTTNLLWTGILGRHRAHQRSACGYGRIEQLGDAEIQKLWHSIIGHENVAGLDVAMDHQPLMRILHCLTD